MAELQDRLEAARNIARKAHQKDRTLLLGTILAALKNRRIEVQRELTDVEVVEVIQKGVKTRRESVEQYRQAGRTDLADAEAAEITMLEEFLPPMADPTEIRDAVRTAIAGGAADLGRVMGQVMPQFKGRADGKVINQIAREELGTG